MSGDFAAVQFRWFVLGAFHFPLWRWLTKHPSNKMNKTNWWKEFGLESNPYVYGPMPRLRTSVRYRIEEARRMGWMAWTWDDEYKDERKGTPAETQKK